MDASKKSKINFLSFKNKPLELLPKSWVKENLKMVTFDLDGVTIPVGTRINEDITGTELEIKTHKLSPKIVGLIKELKNYIHVNFSSGRALLYLQNILGDILWDRASIQGENGNFTLIEGKIIQSADYTNSYLQKLTNIKEDLKKIKSEQPDIIKGFEPKHMILSLHTERPEEEVCRIVEKRDPEKELYCQWTSEGYDIGKKGVNKGSGLEFLTSRLGFDRWRTIAIGNNVNDREMVEFGVGITTNPKIIEGNFFIEGENGKLPGEIFAEYLVSCFK